MRFSSACLIVLTLALSSRAALSSGDAAERQRVVEGLQGWLDATVRLEARFRQSLVSEALGTTATESGRLYLERPGKIRWEYLEPDRKSAVLLGDRTELYLQEDRLLIRGHLEPEQALFPRLLAGRDRVEEAFDARMVATPATGGNGAYRLRLVPRAGSSGLAAVTLTLRPPSFAIESAEVLDEAGNRTSYALSGVRRNRPLPDGIFAFEPPPGTEIMEQP